LKGYTFVTLQNVFFFAFIKPGFFKRIILQTSIMRKSFIALLLVVFIFSAAQAQKRGSKVDHSLGFGLGPSFALTDLGGGKDIARPFIYDLDFRATRIGGSFYYRMHFTEFMAIRANFLWAFLHGNDNFTQGTPPPNPSGNWFREVRNLNFSTHVKQFSLMAEVNLKKYNLSAGAGDPDRWAPYVAIGAGVFHFNPFTEYNGRIVKLRDLGTEGQGIVGDKYSLWAYNMVLGGGMRFNINSKFSLGLELLYHHTSTDYLDDVSTNYPDADVYAQMSPLAQALSNRNLEPGAPYPDPRYNYTVRARNGSGQQRGDDSNNDHFFNVQVTLSINLGVKSGKNRDYGCYKF
jgi:opacity protein-like surface antigen